MDFGKPGNTPREIIVVVVGLLVGTAVLFFVGILRNPF